MSSHVARLRSHVRVPLHRSAYALTFSTIGSAALGILYWAVASRMYSPDVVGLSSAVIAALTFVTGVAGLYLDGALYRFLPRAGDATGRLLVGTFILSALSSVLAGGIFVLGVDLWAPALSFMDSSPWVVLACIGVTVAFSLFALEDAALTGLRQTTWVPIKNVSYNLAKIVPLVLLAGAVPHYGILVAWVVPSAVVVPAVAYLLGKRLLPLHRERSRRRQEMLDVHRVARYSAANYAGFLCMLAYRNLPPILVLHHIGESASAFFYPPWLIATSLTLLTTNLSISLIVEGTYDRSHLVVHARRAIRQTARLIVPIALVLFVGAPYILRVFGAAYAEEGDTLLRLLALGLLPSSLCVLSFGLARTRDRMRAIIANQALLATLVLGLSVLLLPSFGINGVGVGWLAAQTAVSLLLFWTELRPVLKGSAKYDGESQGGPDAKTRSSCSSDE